MPTAKEIAAKNSKWLEKLEPQERRAIKAQSYKRANQRKRCETCASFVMQIVSGERRHDRPVELSCGRGGFPVNRMGVCDEWTLLSSFTVPQA